MHRELGLGLGLAMALCTACKDDRKACTLEAWGSVLVHVQDAQGTPVPAAEVTFSAGDMEDEPCKGGLSCAPVRRDGGTLETDCTQLSYLCGVEIAGMFLIRVQAPGFTSAEERVRVTSDRCHVNGEVVDVVLTRR